MASLKRKFANIVENMLGISIVYPEQIALLHEQVHLRRFFAHFGVDCVFDVGANEGQYAEMLRQKVGYKGPIISFEPIPEVALSLRAKAARDPAWHVVELALDETAGERTFHVMEGSEFSSLKVPIHSEVDIFEDKNRVVRSIQVPVSTLETEVGAWSERLQFKRPFLKVDTQGNDIEVVRGGGKTLRMFVGMQAELVIRRIYEGTDTFDHSISYYRSMGFELSAFVPNNTGHFPQLIESDCIMFRRDFFVNTLYENLSGEGACRSGRTGSPLREPGSGAPGTARSSWRPAPCRRAPARGSA